MTDNEKKFAAALGEMQRHLYDVGFAPDPAWDFRTFQVEPCPHEWKSQLNGGDPQNPDAREVVTVCELCGAEKADE